MYRSSNNLSVTTKYFDSVEEFEDFLNNPFRRVVEILKYNETEFLLAKPVTTVIKVTVIIDNNVEY